LLGGCRNWDEVGPKPIPTSEVESYLNLAGVEDPETRMKYLRLIRRMDLKELSIIHERLKRSRKS